MACKKIPTKANKICLGEFKNKITIQIASIKSQFGKPATTLFENVLDIYARIDTRETTQFFDEVNRSQTVSIIFYIPYTSLLDLTREIWVLYQGTRYKVITTENINQNNNIIKLLANTKGSELIAINNT